MVKKRVIQQAVFLAMLLIASNISLHAVSRVKSLSYSDLVDRLTDLERLASPVCPGEKTYASTSYDRDMGYNPETDTYQHWGANRDGLGAIRREGDTEVMVDLEGPGVLWRIWSAMPKDGHIRIYLDNSSVPVINKPFNAYFDDLEKQYPGLAMTLSRGRNTYIPISFAKSCMVVVDKDWGKYFHCTHTIFPKGTKVEPFAGFTPEVIAALKAADDAWRHRGVNPYPQASGASSARHILSVAKGKTQTLRLDGAGAVRVLKVRPLDMPQDRIAREDVLRELTLSIFWDGKPSPSVWSPLGDFFATSPGLNPFKTLPMGCIDETFYSYWYMPFSDGMRMVFANDGTASRLLDVELETVALDKAVASELLRFSATWHGDDFTGLDVNRFMKAGGDRWPDWPLLVVNGRGRFVGMNLHIWKFGGWWGEGDEKFFIDGETYPSTVGTGSEDYIGYAWAANPPFVTFDSALAACSRLRPDAQEDTSVCRFHVCDDLSFSESFQGFIEAMPNDDCRPCLYDSCAYWYAEAHIENPYPVVPLDRRRHQRPSRDMKHIVPMTLQEPPFDPDAIEGESLSVTH